jgi:predicted metal-dependent phosphoesterase TrpH
MANLPPEEFVYSAIELGFNIIAITGHDSVDGVSLH